MTSARVAVAARRERRPTRTSRACRARVPLRRRRPAQRRPPGRGLSVVRCRRQGVLGTCLLHEIGVPTCSFAGGLCPLPAAHAGPCEVWGLQPSHSRATLARDRTAAFVTALARAEACPCDEFNSAVHHRFDLLPRGRAQSFPAGPPAPL